MFSTVVLFVLVAVGAIFVANQAVAQSLSGQDITCDPITVSNSTFNHCIDQGGSCASCADHCVDKCQLQQFKCNWDNSTEAGCEFNCYLLGLECILA